LTSPSAWSWSTCSGATTASPNIASLTYVRGCAVGSKKSGDLATGRRDHAPRQTERAGHHTGPIPRLAAITPLVCAQGSPDGGQRARAMTGAVKNRWHQLADAISSSNMRASDKSVFRHLLDKADYATAILPPKFTPNQAAVAKRTSHSIRQVKYAIDHLRRHGWLRTGGRTGPGHTLTYTISLGTGCDCTGRVHSPERVQPDRSTGATGAPERVQPTGATPQVRPHANQEATRGKGVRRGHLRDDDWWPADTIGAEINGETYPPAADLSRYGQPLTTLTVCTLQQRTPAPDADSQPQRTRRPDLSASWPSA
jgi:hypothetical protein